MIGHRSFWLVAYDITSDHERAKVDRLLKGWGFRLQKSLWSVATGRPGIKRLADALEALGIQTGQVLIFRLESDQAPIAIGKAFENPDGGIAYFV